MVHQRVKPSHREVDHEVKPLASILEKALQKGKKQENILKRERLGG